MQNPIRTMYFKWIIGGLFCALMLAGCTDEPTSPSSALRGTDMSTQKVGGEFTLTDHHGQRRALSSFKGQAVVLNFGYIHCPDICPTTLAELANAMQQLGAEAERVQVLFVSVDPERDTPDIMKSYVTAFHPDFLGLTGTPDEIHAVRRQFKVIAEKQGDIESGAYTVDHSAGSYVYDPNGQLRVYIPYGAGVDVFEHDLRAILHIS